MFHLYMKFQILNYIENKLKDIMWIVVSSKKILIQSSESGFVEDSMENKPLICMSSKFSCISVKVLSPLQINQINIATR